ncbi:metallophosphoesterase family protein [Hyphomicrobiales bacterium]
MAAGHPSRIFQRIFSRKARSSRKSNLRQRRRLSLPLNEYSAIYAVGDVHGCYEELLAAVNKIRIDAASYTKALVVFLGDYVDRGPRSREVIDYLANDGDDKIHQIALCGNHDAAFARLLDDPHCAEEWLRFAGQETLLSYGIDVRYIFEHGGVKALHAALKQQVPTHHAEFLRQLPTMLEVGDLVFVHAGVRPGIPLQSQSDQDLLWIRTPFLDEGPQLPVIVIHGHTPVGKPFFGNGRIGIDTAAFATGNLTVLKIAGKSAQILT